MDALRYSRAVFVQPHLDDIALSCGATVARAADAGDHPVLVGVCTGPPTPGQPLGPAVRALHAKWGLGDDAWRARRGEDERACAILGATPLWLPYQDAPYRGYDSFAAVFAGLSADEPLIQQVANDLLAVWRRTAGAIVYLPLGIGGHVDHRICHAAGASLEAAGVPVRYYEDFPYAAIPGLVSARLAELAGAYSVERIDVTASIDRRVQAAAAYASQVASLFSETSLVPGPIDRAIRRHAGALGGGLPGVVADASRLAECFYRRASPQAGDDG